MKMRPDNKNSYLKTDTYKTPVKLCKVKKLKQPCLTFYQAEPN